MTTYKATKGAQTYFKNFADLAAAEAYFLAELGWDWLVLEASADEQIPDLTPAQKAARHREFGAYLFQVFLDDNADFAAARGSNFTVEETMAMDAKFGDFGRLCTYGSIPQIAILLPGIATDTIFTQERKDKYISMVNAHLAG